MRSRHLLELTSTILTILAVSAGCMANPSATPIPSLAATATVTLPPTRTPAPTRAITYTPDDVATLHAIETASIKTLISTIPPAVLEENPSPDGSWQARVIRYDCMNYPYPDHTASIAYEQLNLVNLTVGTEQMIKDQLQNCDGIGGGGLDGLYWSPSNRYFYYTDWREGNPEGCGNYAVPMIYRFDTLRQENSVVGGGHISPDQTELAMWQKSAILIWDLDQGEIGRIESLEKIRFPGEISWSPDGQSLVYLQTEWDCAPDYGKTYLTRLNLLSMSQELLLEQEAPGFGSASWDSMDRITLRDGQNNEWTYSISKKELKAPLAESETPNAAQPEQGGVYYMVDGQLFLQSPGGQPQAILALPDLGQVKDALKLEESIFVIRERGLQKVSLADKGVELVTQFPETTINGRLLADPNQGMLFYAIDGKVEQYDLRNESTTEVLSQPGFLVPLGLSQEGSKLYLVPRGGDPEFPEVWVLSLNNGEVKPLSIGVGVEAALSPDSQHLAVASTHFVQSEQSLEYKLTLFDPASPQTSGRVLTLPNPPSHIHGRPVWSPDSQTLYFLLRPGAPYDEPRASGLWRFEQGSETFSQVAPFDDPYLHFTSLSPDGALALLMPETKPSITLVHIESGEIETIEVPTPQFQFTVVRYQVIPK